MGCVDVCLDMIGRKLGEVDLAESHDSEMFHLVADSWYRTEND